MGESALSKVFLHVKRYQNNVCVKLAIVVAGCCALCFACFLVEGGNSSGQEGTDHQQSSEKLIQIKSNRIQDSLTQFGYPDDISLKQENDLYIEGSGQHPDPPKAASVLAKVTVDEGPAHASFERQGDLFKRFSDFNSIPKGIKQDIPQVIPEIGEIDEHTTPKNKDIFMGPEDLQPQNEGDIFRSIEVVSDDGGDPMFFSIEEQFGDAVRLTSDEEFLIQDYPSHYGFDEPDGFSEEYILADYNNGEYIEVESPPRPYNPKPDNQIPSFIDSFLVKMSTLFKPVPRPTLKPTHLANFNHYAHKTDHLPLESSITAPKWKPKFENSLLNKIKSSNPLLARPLVYPSFLTKLMNLNK